MGKKKFLKRKGKLIAALAVVISFAAVLSWHQVQNAHAYTSENIGSSKHYQDGYAVIMIDKDRLDHQN